MGKKPSLRHQREMGEFGLPCRRPRVWALPSLLALSAIAPGCQELPPEGSAAIQVLEEVRVAASFEPGPFRFAGSGLFTPIQVYQGPPEEARPSMVTPPAGYERRPVDSTNSTTTDFQNFTPLARWVGPNPERPDRTCSLVLELRDGRRSDRQAVIQIVASCL